MTEETTVPKKKNPILVLIDTLTLGIWKIFAVIFFIVWIIIRGIGQMFSGIWKALGEAESLTWFWKPMNNFFRFLGQCWGVIWYAPAAISVGFYNGMNKSAGLRRFMLLVLLIMLGVWYYFYGPHPSWGKWHHYYDSTVSRYSSNRWYYKTANNEWVISEIMFYAAHPSLPMGSHILLENKESNKKLVVRINDRKEHVYLSAAAAKYLGVSDTNPFPLQVYTRKKLLDDPEPETQPAPAADPREVPGEWVDELQVKPFEKNTPIKPPEPEPVPTPIPLPAPSPPTPQTIPVVQAKPTPKKPEVKPKPAPVKKSSSTKKPTTVPANSDDRLQLSDPVLVPDRR